MLLYMVARAQLVDEVIRPALAAGRVVVCDRFLLANIVYQGYGSGLPLESVRQVGAVATDGITPDCTFLLDMAPDAALRRMGRELDRIESRGPDYRERLRQGFLAEARVSGTTVHVIDAAQAVDVVQAAVQRIATTLFTRGAYS
jgi:dTMP kinase